jgi:dihydrofolate reductase
MRVTLIVAMAENRAIGLNNAMPWHLPEDLRRFRALTMGHPILMGRKTHEAIGRPLPGRRNLVMTRQHDLEIPGCERVGSLEDVRAKIGEGEPLFVIGGAELYQWWLPTAERIELTVIHQAFEGDTFFPPLEANEWQETARTDCPLDKDLGFAWSYLTLDRLHRPI